MRRDVQVGALTREHLVSEYRQMLDLVRQGAQEIAAPSS